MSRRRDPDILFYVPDGENFPVKPRAGETLDQAYLRLKRRARSYAEKGRYFAVQKGVDSVHWVRVEKGETKHPSWIRTPVGGEATLSRNATGKDLSKARDTARYLRRKGVGDFTPRLDGERLVITRNGDSRASD